MDPTKKGVSLFSLSPAELSISLSEIITKKQLCIALGINPRTFSKRLSAMEPELKQISPRYNKLGSILTPKEALFIVEEFGVELEEVRKKYWENVNPK